MPTKREREYYRMGFRDGTEMMRRPYEERGDFPRPEKFERQRPQRDYFGEPTNPKYKKKRKLSAWNKFVKANSKKPRFRYRNGKLNLKKMAVAFRKTPAGRKKKRR